MVEKSHRGRQKKAITSSIGVAIFTALFFFGLFIRDYLMAKVFGFGSELDSFYLVTMPMMFMVSIFCIPFGQAAIPKLKKMLLISNDRFLDGVRHLSFLAVAFCIFLCLLNYFFSKIALNQMNHFGWIKINEDINLLQLSVLPILFLSGLIILCNSILSARERYIYPSIAQIIVPGFAILFLILFGKLIGIFVVILGMIIGQFINFIFLYFALKKDKVRLFPFEFDFKISPSFWISYAHLVLIAFFTASLLLINTYLSTILGEGAASIFNLGTKFSMFIIGILTAVFANVLLPYLSDLSLNQDNRLLKKETYVLVLTSTFFIIPFSVAIHESSEWFSHLIFDSIVSEPSIILGISSVVKYNVIQLPFWIFNSILFRHAKSINQVGIITISSILLLLLDLLFGLNLIKYMNIGGLAISISASTAITSCLMLVYYVYKKHFKLTEGIIIIVIWIIFGSILLGLNFERCLNLIDKVI